MTCSTNRAGSRERTFPPETVVTVNAADWVLVRNKLSDSIRDTEAARAADISAVAIWANNPGVRLAVHKQIASRLQINRCRKPGGAEIVSVSSGS